MAVTITKADAKRFQQRYEAVKSRINRIKESAEETTERLVATAEVGGSAFAMGVIQGKTGGVALFGVPLELGVGLAANIFGLMGGAGKGSTHLINVGNGALAAYATTMGRGVGASWAQKSSSDQSSLPSQASVSGLRAGGMSMEDIMVAQQQAAGVR